jgi:hypothetical protein
MAGCLRDALETPFPERSAAYDDVQDEVMIGGDAQVLASGA